MEDHQRQEDGDLFEEIQAKVEKGMFQEPGEGDTEKRAEGGSGAEQGRRASIDESKIKIVVEVDVVDTDTTDPLVDDSFLEEIDCIPPEAHQAVVERESGVEGGAPVMSELPAADEITQSSLDALADVQEDDLFLGELIDREMIGTMTPAGDALASAPAGESVQSSEAKKLVEGMESKEVLNTRTLADLYAQQGLYHKALDIYEDLLQESPSDDGIRSCLNEVKKKLAEAGKGPLPSTVPMGQGEADHGRVLKGVMIQRLESWLARIQSEKERRCLRSS
jgi:hypothetical protein